MKLTFCFVCSFLLLQLSCSAKHKKKLTETFDDDDDDESEVGELKKQKKPIYNVSIADFPFMVGLVKLYDQNSRHYCSAAIISDFFALTSAHCVYPQNVQRALFLGAIVLRGGQTSIDGNRGYDHRIYGFTIHPDYNSSTYYNDIAVIQVKDSFDRMFETSIKYAHKGTPLPNKRISIFGWRKIESDGVRSKLLRYTKTKITKCDWNGIPNDEGWFCARINDKNECSGDSGGAVVFEDTLIGISSWGRPCQLALGVTYTRVEHYSEWIAGSMANITVIIDN